MKTFQGDIQRVIGLCFAVSAAVFPASAVAANLAPVVDSVTFSPTPVAAGSTNTISCAAHDDYNITEMRITVSGGTLPGGVTQLNLTLQPAQAVVGTVAWSVPTTPGSYSVTCFVRDDAQGWSFGKKSATRVEPVTVEPPAGNPPIIGSLTASAQEVLPGATVQVRVAASDADGDPLTYSWSASGGTISGTGATATWTAAGTVGSATITVTVSDGTGMQASGSLVVSVKVALWGGALPVDDVSAGRIINAPSGDFYVVETRSGQLAVLTPRGELKGLFRVPGRALSLAHCWGSLMVATAEGRLFQVDADLKVQGETSVARPVLVTPTGLACDSITGLLFVAEHNAGRVRALRQDGTVALTLTRAGTDILEAPIDVAVDTTARRLWVLLNSYRVGTGLQLHSFALDGTWTSSAAQYGGSPGRFTRGSGLAVGPNGRLYVTDAFQSTAQVLDATGAPIDVLGTYGTGAGQLRLPLAVTLHPRGDVVVANAGNHRLEFFGNGQPLPGCAGDADCDGLPDAWELLHGLNPNDPRDALADSDGDGLTNARELALGTDPRNRDTDGDGWSDGEEVALGKDPLFPGDQLPALVALSTPTSDPGLVRLDAQLQGRGICTVDWVQTQGATVTLRDPTTPTPSFVARTPGTYTFTGTPRCGPYAGVPAAASLVVRNVPPRAEPGRLVVVPAGESFWLDGSFSWDPNGGPLAFLWDQALGPPRLAPATSADVWVRAHQPGLYAFQLTAQDPAGNAHEAEVPVLVVERNRVTPTALVESPLRGQVGQAVVLDATDSVGAPGVALTFDWRQTAGPQVTVRRQPQPGRAVFTPLAAGRYGFEVAVQDGALQSPWAPVDVYVAETAAGLPVAATDPQRIGTVGEPLTLSGVQSRGVALGASLTYRWRQLSGPAAGLTNAASESATVVPFSPGVSKFELVVKEGAMESVPAVVTVQADVPGQARPVARAAGPAVSTVHAEVVLDGSGSSGTGGTLRYRWTQVAGPWVPLDDPRGAVAAFTPRLPGLYVFELEVDDGATRSGSTSVGVLVFPASPAGGRP